MDGIRATFTQKFGPLPVWGWAAIGLAAIGAYLYFTHKGPFAGVTSGDSAAASNGAGSGAGSDFSSLLGSYGQWQPAVNSPYSGGLAGGGGGLAAPVTATVGGAPDPTSRGSSTAPAPAGSPPTFKATTAPALIAAKYPVYSPLPPTIFTARGPVSTDALAAMIGSPRTFNPQRGRSSGTKAVA